VGASDLRIVYYGSNKLRDIIKAYKKKNPLPNLCKKNVVYKLSRSSCKARRRDNWGQELRNIETT